MNTLIPHYRPAHSRREFLVRGGAGFGGLALAHLMAQGRATAGSAHTPHVHAKAKRVIFLFMEGGPSHIDLFDPKPKLNELEGQPLPESFGNVITAMGESRSPLLGCKRKWQQHGESGHWISDWLPHTARHADKLCVIRSCWADGLNHVGSVCQMNTGSTQAGRPSLGSWVHYGLGTENENLPAFAVLLDNPSLPMGGSRNWGTGFMPGSHAGTKFRSKGTPIPNLFAGKNSSEQQVRAKHALLASMNRSHAEGRDAAADELEARIQSYELAFRMQATAPEAVDLSKEPESLRALYGLDQKHTSAMARSCLLARRLSERGVRFVQVYSGSGSKWDSHSDIEGNHGRLCRGMDQPVAALLADLESRGLLEETLVVWGGEFGRTPMSEKGNGRDHNPFGFTMWMAGGGVKPGQTIGATDELGLHAVEDRAHVHDLHATILHAIGLRALDVTYRDQGRAENPVINDGKVLEKVFS